MGEKIKDIIKKTGPLKLIALCVCGVLLLFLSSRTESDTASFSMEEEQTEENQYETRYEKQLETILKQIEGIDKAQVMMTVSQGEDHEYVPNGVVVVCTGGDQAAVRREVTSVVEALFSIESHKIKVMNLRKVKE
ncbi:MAG: hypothetical protein J5972_02675 [Eubacterium sp.]|nr:hypothetical protein [Eubacterium sp.]